MNEIQSEKFLTTQEVAKLLHINDKKVYTLIDDKRLPATKVTGKWLFPKRLVEEWLETNVINYNQSRLNCSEDEGVLLVAGSDDLLFQKALTLLHTNEPQTVGFFANLGSMGGLKSLQRGICHIAVCHLLQNADQEYNFGFAEQEFVNAPVLVNFSRRQQGLLVPKGNPKNILGLTDLTRENVTMVNRPLGTGTRVLVDYEITEAGISSAKIDGYHNVVSRHLDAGLEVLSGKVDAAPAIQAVAGILGLDFIPLRWERFDLLILRERFFDKKVQTFINLLHGKSFHELAENYEGYDVSSSGKMLYPDNLKMDDSISAENNNNWLEDL